MALEPVAKERYMEKLRLLSMSEKDDPYASSNEMKFVDNMALWPAVEFGPIFCYFIERPGTLTSSPSRKMLIAYARMYSGGPVQSPNSSSPSCTPLFLSQRKSKKSQSYFLSYPVGATNYAAIVDHLSARSYRWISKAGYRLAKEGTGSC